jgi:hypothetical protein
MLYVVLFVSYGLETFSSRRLIQVISAGSRSKIGCLQIPFFVNNNIAAGRDITTRRYLLLRPQMMLLSLSIIAICLTHASVIVWNNIHFN